jgi:hypothetical protein
MSMTGVPSSAPKAEDQARRQLIKTLVLSAAWGSLKSSSAIAETNSEISRDEEAIHQLRTFKTGRRRVYDALTVQSEFDKVVQLSGVMQSPAMARMQKPTLVSDHVGGEVALFGGYIVGRQIELQPGELIVQAWRVLTWPRGLYSIARFELTEQAGATSLVFDHRGFPKGQADHLASGWQEHYWDPLTQYLA